MKKSFGILTMATQKDYLKAIGLSISLKISNVIIPISVVCSQELEPILSKYFNSVIIERDDLIGFQHKIFLDEYSPYSTTLFLDADMLVFKSIMDMIDEWSSFPYIAQGHYETTGVSHFGLNTEYVLDKIGCNRLSSVTGAGHAFFNKPDCYELFKTARKIMKDYDSYGDNLRFADEDVINIAMTMHDYPVHEGTRFMGMPVHAQKSTLFLNTLDQKCRYKDQKFGWVEPYVMHFAARQSPFLYLRELLFLYKYGEVPRKYTYSLYHDAISKYLLAYVERPIRKKIKNAIKIVNSGI